MKTAMSQPLIQFDDVHKAFDRQVVLQGINMSIYQGDITTIIGKSGGGKSVLLKHVIGLLEPDRGQILFKGQPLHSMKKSARRQVKRRFSYMFQGTALFDSLTIFDNIALPLKERTGMKKADIRQRVFDKMAQLDLHDIAHKYPAQISGGMKKRVALARALVVEPEIVLFDEPTTGLDPIRKNAVHAMIADYQKQFGFTGVVVSHEIPDIFYISQRIAMLNNGRIIFEGTPAEILESPDAEVQQFIHGLQRAQDDQDDVEGIGYRRRIEKRFQEELVRLQRDRLDFSLILFTLENLHEITTRMGPLASQNALRQFAGNLHKYAGITNTCTYYSPNRILALLSSTDEQQALTFCESFAAQLNGRDISPLGPYPDFCFNVSVGYAQAGADQDLDQLIAEIESREKRLFSFTVC